MSKQRHHGFTLVELLVVIGIIALLISILLPSLNNTRKMAKSVQCLSNLRQLGMGYVGYANNNRGSTLGYAFATNKPLAIEAADSSGIPWIDQLAPYFQSARTKNIIAGKLAFCPEATNLDRLSASVNTGSATTAYNQTTGSGVTAPIYGSYGVNIFALSLYLPLGSVNDNAQKYGWKKISQNPNTDVPVFCDSIWVDIVGNNVKSFVDSTPINPPASFMVADTTNIQRAAVDRHNRRVNVAFKDGSARSIRIPDLWDLQWNRVSTPQRANVIDKFPSRYQ